MPLIYHGAWVMEFLDCVLLNYGQKKKKNHLNQMVSSSKEFVTHDVIWLERPRVFAFIGH